MRYLKSKAISTSLIEKSNIEELISNHANILIRVAKLVDKTVIRVEILKC